MNPEPQENVDLELIPEEVPEPLTRPEAPNISVINAATDGEWKVSFGENTVTGQDVPPGKSQDFDIKAEEIEVKWGEKEVLHAKVGETVVIFGSAGYYQTVVHRFPSSVILPTELKALQQENFVAGTSSTQSLPRNLQLANETCAAILTYKPIDSEKTEWEVLASKITQFQKNGLILYHEMAQLKNQCCQLAALGLDFGGKVRASRKNFLTSRDPLCAQLQELEDSRKRLLATVIPQGKEVTASEQMLTEMRFLCAAGSAAWKTLDREIRDLKTGRSNLERDIEQKKVLCCKYNSEIAQYHAALDAAEHNAGLARFYADHYEAKEKEATTILAAVPLEPNPQQLEAYQHDLRSEGDSRRAAILNQYSNRVSGIESNASQRIESLQSWQNEASSRADTYAWRNYGPWRGMWDNDVKNQYDKINIWEQQKSTALSNKQTELNTAHSLRESELKSLEDEQQRLLANFRTNAKQALEDRRNILTSRIADCKAQREKYLAELEPYRVSIKALEGKIAETSLLKEQTGEAMNETSKEIELKQQSLHKAIEGQAKVLRQYTTGTGTASIEGVGILLLLLEQLPQQILNISCDIIAFCSFIQTLTAITSTQLHSIELECEPEKKVVAELKYKAKKENPYEAVAEQYLAIGGSFLEPEECELCVDLAVDAIKENPQDPLANNKRLEVLKKVWTKQINKMVADFQEADKKSPELIEQSLTTLLGRLKPVSDLPLPLMGSYPKQQPQIEDQKSEGSTLSS